MDYSEIVNGFAPRTKAQKLADAMRNQSVMNKPMQPQWQPEYEKEPALEAPPLSPDDLIGIGIPTKLASLAAIAAKGFLPAMGAAGAAMYGIGKTAAAKGVSTEASKLAQAIKDQSGAIVWHGSPHKFDKFDMSKIGTGEGAQAYGHGLYMAEAPETAMSYRASVSRGQEKAFGLDDGPTKGIATLIAARGKEGEEMARKAYANLGQELEPTIQAAKNAVEGNSQLYKVDIPDEAVARFLDWDKPLSQQAPEVQAAIQKLNPTATQEQIALAEAKKQAAYDAYMSRPASMDADAERSLEAAYSQAYRAWQDAKGLNSAQGSLIYHGLAGKGKDASRLLQDAGIPGIRYLDGGSRGTGAGTSNFVLFDDQMPRILEVNGKPTGNQPWKPGEWGLLGGGM